LQCFFVFFTWRYMTPAAAHLKEVFRTEGKAILIVLGEVPPAT
jgi:hypothetical protein